MSKFIINIIDNDQEKPDTEITINGNAFDVIKVFDEACMGWERNHEYNKVFLGMQQNYLNELLKKRGYLFLNEAYAALDLPPTKIGQVVGWINREDSYVDLGFNSKLNVRFMNGDINTFVVEPNVDGIILHKVY